MGGGDPGPSEHPACNRAQPPVAIAAIVKENLLLTQACEVSNPDWMVPVEQIAEARGIAHLRPGQRPACNCTQPPITITSVVEEDLIFVQVGEIADPYRVVPIEQIAKSRGIAHLCPGQRPACNCTQPPITITSVVEEDLISIQVGEIADPYRVVSIEQVAKARGITYSLPSQRRARYGAEPPVAVTTIIEQDLGLPRTGEIPLPKFVVLIA